MSDIYIYSDSVYVGLQIKLKAFPFPFKGQESVNADKIRTSVQLSLSLALMEGTQLFLLKPNTHRRRRRDETVESRRVGGVYTNSQLVGDSFVVSSV